MARWDKTTTGSIPDWFWRAVETPSEKRFVEVEDCDVCYRLWEDAENAPQPAPSASPVARPRASSMEQPSLVASAPQRRSFDARRGMLLIHGMNAHSRWWDFIAPQLLDDYRVAAMDLTGMGDSDYRYAYEAETYAREIVAVCDAAGFGNDAVVVGHSFGGVMAVKAANLYPDRFGALVLVDSGIRHPDEPVSNQPMMGGGRTKVYPDRQSAESRFRLYPPQPCDNRYIMEHIARHSLLRVEGGWAWKFDEELPLTLKGTDRMPEDYTAIPIPVGIVHGAESNSFTARTLDYTLDLLGRDAPVVAVRDAQHHVFLDQPLAFIDALKQVLARLPP